MKNYILSIIFLLISFGLKSQDLILHFNFNSHVLTYDSKALLDNYKTDLNNCDSILLIGHTDTVGTDFYNYKLSQKRAASVLNWMTTNSIKTKTIIESKGESKILNSNNDSANRRVELFAYYHYTEFPKKLAQEFIVNNLEDTTIYGADGTMIRVPANSIRPKSTTNEYIVVLTEFYENSDMIFNNLTTRTDTEILETGGMINIEIYNDEKKCTIEKPIQIGFPIDDVRNEEMDIFHGKLSEENEVIWEQNVDTAIYKYPIRARKTTKYSYEIGVQKIGNIVDEMPEFQGGGLNDFQSYIQSNIIYPQIAIDSGYCGRVYVRFTVGIDGSINDASISKGAHSSMDAEVLRVISMSPRWTPGKTRRKNVPVRMSINVPFMLEEDCEPIVNYYRRSSKFNSSVNAKSFDESSIRQINYYIFNTLSLGWINCDWVGFRNKPKTNQKIYVDGLGEISTHLIFSEYNVVLRGYKSDDYFIFNNVPKNENIIVLGIKRIGDKVFFATEKTSVSRTPIKLDNFNEITFEELELELNELKKTK